MISNKGIGWGKGKETRVNIQKGGGEKRDENIIGTKLN